ncbi:MAG: aspartate kinase [Christensenellales bacterium]|jgi:aspartate kinase
MSILVQKFGGSSMATPESRQGALRHILEAKERGLDLVVVVSAMGRKGAPYATDTLLSLGLASCSQLPPREKDLLLSCGETISAAVMAGEITSAGYQARALTGGQAGILTDARYGSADCLFVDTTQLLSLLKDGIIPVVAGFQGMTREGDITTLGRGASDYTAALLATALKAEGVEIYTDVNGIMTADPRVVTGARVLPSVSYSEVFQLADQGAAVIHPRAVETAMQANIPMFIRNTLSDHPGTRIAADALYSTQNAGNIITSITLMQDRAQLTCVEKQDGNIEKLLSRLADQHISIDLINIFPEKVVFTIESHNLSCAVSLCGEIGFSTSVLEACTKVSCVGHRMRGVPGVMARIAAALRSADIPILQTADSHMTISCLVPAEKGPRAVEVLHYTFSLG